MKKLNTVFDYNRDTPEPQFSAIYDIETKKIEFLPLYFKATRNTIKTIRESLFKIFKIMKSGGVMINDTLSHMMALRELQYIPTSKYDIYDTRQPQKLESKTEEDIKKVLVKGLINMPKEIAPWMKVKAKSSAIYSELTSRGVMWGPYHEKPIYDTNTLTGRSRSIGFNIQGTTDKDPIKHIDENRRLFICFDWVSADMRVAGFMSGDDFINNSFIDSDPYKELERLIDVKDITRDDCKIEMLKSIYSVNFDGPLLDVMPNLKKWMSIKKSEYDEGKNLKTILGMDIPRRDLKSSFNGVIQGTIAEAIQSVLIKIDEQDDSKSILTEVHDSLIVCCDEKNLNSTIKRMVPILLRPFDEIDLTFPVKVSIGKKWKSWKEYKVFR